MAEEEFQGAAGEAEEEEDIEQAGASYAELRAQLRASQQQARVRAEQETAEEPDESSVALTTIRESVDFILSKVSMATLALFIFVYWPIKLIGELAPGKLTRVSWDDVIPGSSAILPDSFAKAVAAFGLAVDMAILIPLTLLQFAVLAIAAMAINDPFGAAMLATTLFGQIGCQIVVLVMNIPSSLCPAG